LIFTLSPITEDDARAISGWCYDPPYSIYNIDPDAANVLMDPIHNYHSVWDEDGNIVGYFCYGVDARVRAGVELGLYPEDSLDLGLGMRPDLTGQGLGGRFVQAGLNLAEAKYSPDGFRLTVAAFNKRAIRVYKNCGFKVQTTFGRTPSGEPEWILMQKNIQSSRLNPNEIG
jgi:RimJ/RimL family protein N-acetyltransferase